MWENITSELSIFALFFLLPIIGCQVAAPAIPKDFYQEPKSAARTMSLRESVTDIADGASNLGRLGAVRRRAHTLGLETSAHTEWIDWFSLQRNLVIEIPGQSNELIYIVAHYDKTSANPLAFLSDLFNGALDELVSFSFLSEGAIDNATGVAVALELAAELRSSGPHYYTYRILFTGAEESGLRGSRAHVARLSSAERSIIQLAINIDSVGLTGSPNCVTDGISSPENVQHVIDLAHRLGFSLNRKPLRKEDDGDFETFMSTNSWNDFKSGFKYNLIGGFLPQRSWFTGSLHAPVIDFNACDPLDRPHGPTDRTTEVDLRRLYEQYAIIDSFLHELDARGSFRSQSSRNN